jgi:protein-S-isoprenylcysteine O-methyltransferase Ste14
MNLELVCLFMVNYIYIGILPKIFFKKDGRYNLMWFITAAPMFLNSMVILLAYNGWWPVANLWPTSGLLNMVAVLLSAVSIGMISYTMGTHRIPLALWHQTNDAPANIVTWGAYKYVRHPFYSSFILVQLASILIMPNPGTIFGLAWAVLILNKTAAREEGLLSNSSFGAEYRTYMTKTGRVIPRIGA